MERNSIAGRRVWVTGASAGIGRALADEFVRRGARVAASARNAHALGELASECGDDRLIPIPLDVTDHGANLDAAAQILRRLGGLDIAVLNAGTCEYVDVRHFDGRIFDRVMRTNFVGMAYGVEAALPLLRRSQHPQLAGMSSTVAYGALPRAEAYGASKAAVRHMFECLRIDLAREKIAVSVICPGFVDTPLTRRNDFPMPFLIDAGAAARRIVDGIAARRREIHFPWRFSVPFKLAALLPGPLYTALIRRFTGTP
jgi:NAD(P)-dependent dehydrogenase (short-subunit alcohol dehydrogenase family)